LGFGAGGPAFFWSWPFVLGGQFLVALCFAELAARYPLSGGVYQWSRHLGSPYFGYLTGWIYIACLVVTLAAVPLALQSTLPQIAPVFQIFHDSATNAVALGSALMLLSTVISAFGVRLMARINDCGVIAEILGII